MKAIFQITIAHFKVSFCFVVTVTNQSYIRGENHVTADLESR